MSNIVKLFDLEKIKVSSASPTNKKILITATPATSQTGLKKMLSLLKTKKNLVLRIYFHEIANDTFEMLNKLDNVELVQFYPYELSDPITNSLGVFASLLRYLPLFFNEDNFHYAMVIDLDSKEEIIDEIINYLDQIKNYDFTYSCRKWYRSAIYWYDKLAYKSFYHMVKGCGMGFKLGLLNPEIFLNFVFECSKMIDEKDEFIREFKRLCIEDINAGLCKYDPFAPIIDCDTFPRGTVELFTTFYILPAMLESNYSIMRINIQNKILHCLASDLIIYADKEKLNHCFMDNFNMSVKTFIQKIKEDDFRNQKLWDHFLDLIKHLAEKSILPVDKGLLDFVLEENRTILTKDNNKTILTKKDRAELYYKLLGVNIVD
jgi:hypothetical protein